MIDVYWWSKVKYENSEFENFGDILVPYLLDKITDEKYRRVEPNNSKFLKILKKRHYFIIGSVLRSATTHTVVWGAGIIEKKSVVKNAKFLLTRGPFTRLRLLELGYKVPLRFGDPALLLRLFVKKREIEKGLIGVIPHYVDFEEVSKEYDGIDSFKLINVLTNNPENVIREISKCEYIISSSLHGIIVAHALNIPAIWMKVSNRLYGDDIKFNDYFHSVGINEVAKIPFKNYSHQDVLELFNGKRLSTLPCKENIDNRIRDLIETCPFKISNSFKRSIIDYFNA